MNYKNINEDARKSASSLMSIGSKLLSFIFSSPSSIVILSTAITVLVGAFFICLLPLGNLTSSLSSNYDEETRKAIEYSFENTVYDIEKSVIDNINEEFGCALNYDVMEDKEYGEGDFNSYSYHENSECIATIYYGPDIDGLAAVTKGYYTSVNGALSNFPKSVIETAEKPSEEEKEEFVPYEGDNTVTTNSEGEIGVTEDLANTLKNNTNEYECEESNKFAQTIRDNPDVYFVPENDYYWKKEDLGIVEIPYTVEVENEDGTVTKETKYVTKRNIQYTIPVFYDFSNYKQQEQENVATYLVDEEDYTYDKAREKLNEMTDSYYTNYLTAYPDVMDKVINLYKEILPEGAIMPGIWGISPYIVTGKPGHTGIVGYGSSSWNYGRPFTEPITGPNTIDYWKHSNTIDRDHDLHTLPYATDDSSLGPSMSEQCTQFAATWFYDVYKFVALRGDGNIQAINLVKDCGAESACPVKFEFGSSPSPGSVISLSPNHVIIVDAVYDDGSVRILEGNYDGNGGVSIGKKYVSLSDYGYGKIVAIANPIDY